MSITYRTIGDSITLHYEVRVNDVLTDATVALVVTRPDGTTAAATVTRISVGTYEAPLTLDQAGLWRYRYSATGGANDAEDGSFFVEASAGADLYVTVGELRRELGARPGQLDDGLLGKAVRAASRSIDAYCHRRFWLDPVPVARTFRPQDWTRVELPDIGSTAGLVVRTDDNADGTFETTWTLGTDFLLEPLNADADGGAWRYWKLVAVGPYRFPVRDGLGSPLIWGNAWGTVYEGTSFGLRPGLQVTARWGWSAVPEAVREAATLLAMRLYKRKDTPLGFEGFQDFGAVRITRTDPDIAASLTDFVIPVFA
jgi:hypothetical protein